LSAPTPQRSRVQVPPSPRTTEGGGKGVRGVSSVMHKPLESRAEKFRNNWIALPAFGLNHVIDVANRKQNNKSRHRPIGVEIDNNSANYPD
jgi:hypothetical protein